MRTMAMMAMLGTLATTACAKDEVAVGESMPGGRTASAMLTTEAGAPAGRATATEVAGGLRFTADVSGLPAGTKGIHVHTTGRCEAPGFTTAGGHWNPSTMQHGSQNPQGPHVGDLPNIIIGTDGRGTIGITMPGASMAGLLDADGAAIVVHAAADDLKTDPAGNSGARIACGVFNAA